MQSIASDSVTNQHSNLTLTSNSTPASGLKFRETLQPLMKLMLIVFRQDIHYFLMDQFLLTTPNIHSQLKNLVVDNQCMDGSMVLTVVLAFSHGLQAATRFSQQITPTIPWSTTATNISGSGKMSTCGFYLELPLLTQASLQTFTAFFKAKFPAMN